MLLSVRSFLFQFGKPDEKILKAIEKVDRKDFMLDELKDVAYEDTAIGIGYGQTISQPSTVARMLSLLELEKGDSVLEIGTGSGWNACLIGELVGENGGVFGLEIVDELVEKARQRIEKLGIKNVEIRRQDFRKLKQKFDKIIFTAGILQGQEEIIEDFAQGHLEKGGILVCPFRSGQLMIIKKVGEKIEKSFTDEEYVFVELRL